MQRFDYAKYCYTPYYHYSLQGKQILYLGHPSCFISLFIRTQFCGCCRVIVCQSTIPSLSICLSIFNSFLLIIPRASSCRGYNVFDPSISKSVSPSVLGFFYQRNSSETAHQNFVKLCSYEGHTRWYAYLQEFLIHFFFLGVCASLELRNLTKIIILKHFVILWNLSTEFRETL